MDYSNYSMNMDNFFRLRVPYKGYTLSRTGDRKLVN